MDEPVGKYGTAGDDVIVGTSADEQVFALQGGDRVHGRAGDDDLYGNKWNDSLDGSAGRDALFGGAGGDRSWGGAGDDRFNFNFGNGGTVTGGEGADWFYLASRYAGDAYATITDFTQGEDELTVYAFDELSGEDTPLDKIIAGFDADRDGALSPDNGLRQVLDSGD